jgi:tetratricopeptide (TPR) repeat protein
MFHGTVELLAGEPEEAERTVRAALAALKAFSERWYIGGVASVLGQALYEQGRLQEAWEALNFSDEMSARDVAVPIWNAATRAKILASQRDDRAIAVAERAVALSERTDHINETANALLDLGIVMSSLRRYQPASSAFARAGRLYASKGNVVMASRAYVLRSEIAL